MVASYRKSTRGGEVTSPFENRGMASFSGIVPIARFIESRTGSEAGRYASPRLDGTADFQARRKSPGRLTRGLRAGLC